MMHFCSGPVMYFCSGVDSLFPLWTALGAGAAARQLIGTVTITGMVFSSGFAIFLVPALFVVVERMAHRGGGDKPKLAPVAGPELATETGFSRTIRDTAATR
jgi:AcrB/AcrD/AcrF family